MFFYLLMYLIVCFLQEGDDPRLFKCRWCKVRFTRGLRTHYNIYAHCDRAKGQSACPRRSRATQAGCQLPPLWAQEQGAMEASLNKANSQTTLDLFLSQTTFNVDFLDLIAHSTFQSILRFPPLRAAFKLANHCAN